MKKLLFFLCFVLFNFSIRSQSLSAQEQADTSRLCLYQEINQLGDLPRIEIETNVKKLIRKKNKEVYQAASFRVLTLDDQVALELKGRLRARGNTRKKVSFFPPVKFDFKKSDLDSIGYQRIDKLKFVFPKNTSDHSSKLLLKEFFLYELYQLIDSNGIQAKLVDFKLLRKKKEKYQFLGFVIEDEESFACRTKAQIFDRDHLRINHLDRESFLRMVMFQYMIANTDWAIKNLHNLLIVKLPQVDRLVALPYDFDYAGLVGQAYAVPHSSLPIKSVKERYFNPSYKMSEEEYQNLLDYFLSREEAIYKACDEASYLDSKSIDENKRMIKSFFAELRKPKTLKKKMVE